MQDLRIEDTQTLHSKMNRRSSAAHVALRSPDIKGLRPHIPRSRRRHLRFLHKGNYVNRLKRSLSGCVFLSAKYSLSHSKKPRKNHNDVSGPLHFHGIQDIISLLQYHLTNSRCSSSVQYKTQNSSPLAMSDVSSKPG